MPDAIKSISAREILAGSGKPTVEVCLTTNNGHIATASAPCGTSTGKYEAHALYDGGKRYGGLGVLGAVETVESRIAPALIGKKLEDLAALDQVMLDLDGTPNKSKLGGNAILPVSVACAKAAALANGNALYANLGAPSACRLPVPIATVLAGGSYSPSGLVFEDYLYIMDGFGSFSDALEALVSTRFTLQNILGKRFGPVPDVGGALAPPISDTRQAFDLMLDAVHEAGCDGQVRLGLDVAANEFYDRRQEGYKLESATVSAQELTMIYCELAKDYPLVFLEDAFHEDDFTSHAGLLQVLPQCMIVGDDLFASHPMRIKKGIAQKAANAVLLKINQIGTVTEALEAARIARQGGMSITVSLRSNETNDDFIADLSVALAAEQIKLGSPVRGERNAKYNRLLAIQSQIDAYISLNG